MFYALAIIYVVVCLSACAFQRRLIYFPTKLIASAAEQAAAQNGFSPWRNQAGQIIGWKMTVKVASTGSVLVIHGNAGCAIDRSYLAEPIHEALPLDVHVLEFPGYGARAGSPNMTSILVAAEEAFGQLPQDKPVYLVSESIGAGAAAHLAKLHPDRVKGMAMFVPYDDLASVGQRAMPYLPVRLLLRDRYQPALWLRSYRSPIQFVLAGADEVIPTKFGQRLHDSYQGPKQLQIIPGAHHNEVEEQSPEWWQGVFAFWTEKPMLSVH
ncbi:MAG: alpha/beta hydrolase [Verrucomicrobia bacterium]|nr:MAG: alpha/beta hydrolase [Verrucomicrobiota bacterium]